MDYKVFIDIAEGFGLLSLLTFGFIYIRSRDLDVLGGLNASAAIGLMFGLLIAVVMLDPIRISEGATFDARGGPAILAGVFGGPVAAVITAAIGSLIRYYVQGGPYALGGVVGFALYGGFGILAGYVVTKRKMSIGPVSLLVIGALGSVAVLPAFFVNADFQTGMSILKKAGPIMLVNNLIGTVLVGILLSKADEWVALRKRLAIEEADNARLAVIARETNSGVVITDQLGRTEWVNKAFETLSGYTLEELQGKKPGELLQGPDTDRQTVARISTALKNNQPFNEELFNYNKSGDPYWVEVYCEPFTESDGTSKFLAIEADVTARKESEAVKREFLSVVNHELRTPLTSILGSIGMIKSGKLGELPDAVDRLVGIADQNANRLLQIVNDILDFEKLSTGNMEFTFESLNLADLAQEAIELNKPFAAKHDVTMQIASDSPDALIWGDRKRLGQVLTNLVSNACKFAPDGSTVELNVECRGDVARLEVIDQGPGIPDIMSEKVFDRFTQVDAKDTRSVGGTGLGLSISKAIIDRHGGRIGQLPNEPTGSVFYIELALEPDKGQDTTLTN